MRVQDFHLISPREPRLPIEDCGHPNTVAMIRQLGRAMGLDLPAVTATPEQVWSGLLDEVERRFRPSPAGSRLSSPAGGSVSPEDPAADRS